MKRSVYRYGAMVAAFAISGCGGSSTGGDQSFEALLDRGERLANEFISQTPTAVMPTAGTAQYSGVGGLYGYVESVDVELYAIGEVELSANFSNSTISGRMSNFRGDENTRVSGSLSIDNGTIVGNSFAADMGGSLSGDGLTVGLDLELDGGFRGAGARYVGAAITGTGNLGLDTFVVDGFLVARQR